MCYCKVHDTVGYLKMSKRNYTAEEAARMLWGEDSGSESSDIGPAEMDSVFVTNDVSMYCYFVRPGLPNVRVA